MEYIEGLASQSDFFGKVNTLGHRPNHCLSQHIPAQGRLTPDRSILIHQAITLYEHYMRRIIAAICLAAITTIVTAQQMAVLPIVLIETQRLTTTFASGTFTLTSAHGDTLMSSNAQLRYRGATSLQYDKKSIAVKLTKPDGGKRNAQLLGMRHDNYWILDAAAIDMSRMRNRVTTDLWLDFSRTPQWFQDHTHIANGTRGQYVEVYINSRYHGLYCLTERIDRKQLGLEEWDTVTRHIHGYMTKAVKWSDNTCFYPTLNQTARDTVFKWGGFEAKYPDAEDGESWTWQPLTQFFTLLSSIKNDELAAMAEATVDMNVFIDFILLTYLIEGEDNVAKNYYLSCGDTEDPLAKWFITPWDTDHSWGRRYDSTKQDAEVVKVTTLSTNNLARRLDSISTDFFLRLRLRYCTLRHDKLSEESLAERFATYASLFERTGAWERERERWSGNKVCPPPLDEEMDYITQWIHRRLEVMDDFFDNKSSLSSTPCQNLPTYFYSIDGQRVKKEDMASGHIYISRRGCSVRKFLFCPQ